MHEAECAMTMLTQCLKENDLKASVLKNAAEIGLVPALEAAAGRATAFGDAQEQACKALNSLKHTASAALVASLAAAVDGPDANCRLCALAALKELCELEANVVAIPESLDMSVLERVVGEGGGRDGARRGA